MKVRLKLKDIKVLMLHMPQVILQESKILMSKPFFEPQWPGPVFFM